MPPNYFSKWLQPTKVISPPTSGLQPEIGKITVLSYAKSLALKNLLSMMTSQVLNLTRDLKRNETWPLASGILHSRAEGTEKEMTHVI